MTLSYNFLDHIKGDQKQDEVSSTTFLLDAVT